MKPTTATEIMMRMNWEDQKRLIEDMPNYKGEVVRLTITDSLNRFPLGEFEAKITKWIPKKQV